MRIAKQPGEPTQRRYRFALLGLVVAAVMAVAVATVSHLAGSKDGSTPPATAPPDATESSKAPSSTIGTREEVVARLRQIFRTRDHAIQARDLSLLEGIYTVDCPCLKGDQQLIRNLKDQRLLWRGIEVALEVQTVEQINDRLWTVIALVKTSSFDITRESGVVLRRVPQGQELSRFALTRLPSEDDWLLGFASVIEERG
jgi:hypothetical protein